jgi:hypothetical protein
VVATVYDVGAGRFVLNGTRVRETLGSEPAAERPLRSMLRSAGCGAARPLGAMRVEWRVQFGAIGHRE